MKQEQDHSRDLVEIRSMMERSSKFIWLSSWAGILAGIYSLAGAWIAYQVFDFNPGALSAGSIQSASWQNTVLVALVVLVLAAATAVFFSYKRAHTRGERLWNATSRRLLINMIVPFITGGLVILILISRELIGLVAPFSLLFYGLALYNGSKYTYEEVRFLGIVQIVLGLIGAYYVEYGLFCWAIGFGIVHIIYGIYIHFKFER